MRCENGMDCKKITITADSGAADSVVPPGAVKNVKINEHEASRRKLQFCAANGTGIDIYGEQEIRAYILGEVI